MPATWTSRTIWLCTRITIWYLVILYVLAIMIFYGERVWFKETHGSVFAPLYLLLTLPMSLALPVLMRWFLWLPFINLPVVVGIVLLVNRMKADRERTEGVTKQAVARIIERRLSGELGPNDWDYLLSVQTSDPDVEDVQLALLRLESKHETEGQAYSPEELATLRTLLQKLRSGSV